MRCGIVRGSRDDAPVHVEKAETRITFSYSSLSPLPCGVEHGEDVDERGVRGVIDPIHNDVRQTRDDEFPVAVFAEATGKRKTCKAGYRSADPADY